MSRDTIAIQDTPPNAYSTYSVHVSRQLSFYEDKQKHLSVLIDNATCPETREYLFTQVVWVGEIINFLNQWDNRVPDCVPSNSATAKY